MVCGTSWDTLLGAPLPCLLHSPGGVSRTREAEHGFWLINGSDYLLPSESILKAWKTSQGFLDSQKTLWGLPSSLAFKKGGWPPKSSAVGCATKDKRRATLPPLPPCTPGHLLSSSPKYTTVSPQLLLWSWTNRWWRATLAFIIFLFDFSPPKRKVSRAVYNDLKAKSLEQQKPKNQVLLVHPSCGENLCLAEDKKPGVGEGEAKDLCRVPNTSSSMWAIDPAILGLFWAINGKKNLFNWPFQ